MKDIPASIKARLLAIAKQYNKTFDLILVRYCSERLLFRIGESRYKNVMYLKGGALIYAWDKEQARPTRDIDMLAKSIPNDLTEIALIFQEIASIEYQEDGVTFDITSIYAEIIQKEGTYSGIRVNIIAYIGAKTHTKIQIDIGFGDFVIGASEMSYPTFLDMKEPIIQVYSKESVVAEKFEAMIDLGEQNSRMKDFYDVFNILKEGMYDKYALQEAVLQTFRYRETPYIKDTPIFLSEFANQKSAQWESFLKKNQLPYVNFEVVLATIQTHLQVIYEELGSTI